ncbi:MAG TPA: hypothetical protein VEP90_30210, partial [Methylomirabilota bacterium]|nr:hypothetical protein [Methylomirabilota bacterium]
ISDVMYSQSQSNLIESVYGTISNSGAMPSPEFFHERAILTLRNNDIRTLNSSILALLPGNEHTYTSADSSSIDSPMQHQNMNIPIEFLHTLNTSGLPIAHLRLKVGCPIILLCNIDTKQGLCNGTCATILQMSNYLLKICLITGDHTGETALIPQITLSPSVTGLDFAIKLNKWQFPVQLAFAMMINKAQGQTVNQIGIDLRKPVFAHGQLYVAFSHATSSQHIKVLLPPESQVRKMRNVIYSEILLD